MFSNLCRYNILRNKKIKIIPTVLKNTNGIIQQNIIKPDSIEIPDIEYQVLHNLSQFRNDDRTEWVKLGWLLYDTNGSELFIELSKRSKKYKNDDDVLTTFKSFTKESYKINSHII